MRTIAFFLSALLLAASTGRTQTQYRGATVPSAIQPFDMNELDSWNANLARFMIIPTGTPKNVPGTSGYRAEYLNDVQSQLNNLLNQLPRLTQQGISVLVDLHRPPGALTGDLSSNKTVFQRAWAWTLFTDTWGVIASQTAGKVWGYDLLNEPHGNQDRWTQKIAPMAIARIRSFDVNGLIVVESKLGAPKKLAKLKPIPGGGIVYSFHMYKPMRYTHQLDPNNLQYKYPGTINGKYWDRAALRKFLKPVIDWQKQNNTRILLGEFAAARWARGSKNYMEDVIKIAENHGWDWTYHGFREANVWDVERGNDPNQTQRLPESKKELMLKTYMARNT